MICHTVFDKITSYFKCVTLRVVHKLISIDVAIIKKKVSGAANNSDTTLPSTESHATSSEPILDMFALNANLFIPLCRLEKKY